MPDYCSINQYFCETQYVSDLMIFDPNSIPVYVYYNYAIYGGALLLTCACAMSLMPDDATRKMTTNKTNR